MPGRWRRLSRDEREWVDGRIEGCLPPAREIRDVNQGRRRGEGMTGRGPVARGGELGGNQQCDNAAGRGELPGTLEEGHGNVRPVAESAPRPSPPAIATLQLPAHLRRHLFGTKPGRVPRYDVETAAGEYVGEM